MRREGAFRVQYDPDATPMMPRPYQLEGEGKGRKPAYPRGSKPPEKPNIDSAEKANPRSDAVYDNSWLKNAPHRKVKAGAEAEAIRYVSDATAKRLWGKKATGGYYVLTQSGTKPNPNPPPYGQVPNYKWSRVPDNVMTGLLVGMDDPYYRDKPEALLTTLRWLWRKGMKTEYWELWKFAQRRANELARDSADEWNKWAAEYNKWRNEEIAKWRKDTTWWRT